MGICVGYLMGIDKLIRFEYFIYIMMMRVSQQLTNNLLNITRFNLGFGKKPNADNDLPKYDVVIAGGHLGALLGRHLQEAMGPKAKIFVAYDKSRYEMPAIRPFYENGNLTKVQMEGAPQKTLTKVVASSQAQGVEKYLPEKNAVLLKNGRTVEYDYLVVATGLKPEFNIPGFDEAWSELHHPVYSSFDHPSWRISSVKSQRFIHNFNGGQAIFYIPPYPFHTEIENYNFFLAKKLWDRLARVGSISWANSRFTVINANNNFCQFYEKGDSFIKAELEKQNINTEYGWVLTEVKKNGQIAVFKNSKTGETQERRYDNFYYCAQGKPEDIIASAGLGDASGLVDVDPFTLQHKKFANVYGLGDVTNIPTTKTFWAGFNQIHVVRHNLEKQLSGQSPNARYDGYSKATLLVDLEKAVNLSHFYDGKPDDSISTGIKASFDYKMALKGAKGLHKLHEFKKWGPPYYFFKKSFDGAAEIPKSAVELHPEKKTV